MKFNWLFISLLFLSFGLGVASCGEEKDEPVVVIPETPEEPTPSDTIPSDTVPADIAKFNISLPDSSEIYTLTCVTEAEKDSMVNVDLLVLTGNEAYKSTLNVLTVDGKSVETTLVSSTVNELGRHYAYQFTMPGEDVKLTVTLSVEELIVSTDVKNAYLWVLNAYNGKDHEYMDAMPGNHVGFHFNTEFGYEYTGTPEVFGTETNTAQMVFWNEEGTLNGYSYIPCWTFTMPGEPVVIKLHASEIQTYMDKAFVGEYKGFRIAAGPDNMLTGAATLDFNLNGNTSYLAKSTDENKLDFKGVYRVDENANTFSYNPDYTYDPALDNNTLLSHAANGQILKSGDLFIIANDLVTDRPENRRFYFASKENTTYTCAARDAYASYCLIEAQQSAGNSYYLFNGYNGVLEDAEVEFVSGTSINTASSAYIIQNGTKTFKYIYSGNGTPTFTTNDGFGGTYTGEAGDMILDGFGGVTFGGQTGTYVIDHALITINMNGEESTYNINTVEKTYSVFDPHAWTGATVFTATTTGLSGGAEGEARITVYLNRDIDGADTPGKGAIVAEVMGATLSYQSFISSISAFEYDGNAKTITFTRILGKNSVDNESSYNTVTFTVSDDQKTLTSTHERLYQYRTNAGTTALTCINLEGVSITAVE